MALDELSFCPHCDRETPTLRGGSCVECWQPKTSTAKPAFPESKPKTEPLFGWDLDFGSIPGWAWLALVSAIASILLFGVRGIL